MIWWDTRTRDFVSLFTVDEVIIEQKNNMKTFFVGLIFLLTSMT